MSERLGKILEQELAKRCRRNPGYSLRSFARAIGISPANLSLLINGKRRASAKTVSMVLDRIDLAKGDRLHLRGNGLGEPLPADTLEFEQAEKLCHWTCYAILSLAVTAGFKSDAGWVARRLGISVFEVRQSLAALTAAGVLDLRAKSWRVVKEIRIDNRISTATVRDFHRQLIGNAVLAMENEPSEKRDVSSITFAMDPEKMAEAKEEIRRFRLRMSELMEEPGKSTEVYNLTVQLAPATRRKNERVSDSATDPVHA